MFGYEPSNCPCSATIYPELLSLPLYPDMSSEEVEYVCRTLKKIVGRSRWQSEARGVSAAEQKEVIIPR